MNKNQIEELIKKVKSQESERNIHKPYADTSGRLPDFEVEYSIVADPELGDIRPTQGMRCDFLYEGDDPKKDGIHMVWPELLDDEHNVILDKTIRPKKHGYATMWIGMHNSRVQFHQPRIKIGTKGYWVVGSKKIAKVTVTQILGLFENEE